MAPEDARYSHVLSPIRIRNVDVPNRIVRAAHGTGLAAGEIGPDLIAYHEARAHGGVGLTILEIASVHPTAAGGIAAWNESVLAGYAELMKVLRRYPRKTSQQLFQRRPAMRPAGRWSAVVHLPDAELGHRGDAHRDDKGPIELVAGFAGAAARVLKAGPRERRDPWRPWVPRRSIPLPIHEPPYPTSTADPSRTGCGSCARFSRPSDAR